MSARGAIKGAPAAPWSDVDAFLIRAEELGAEAIRQGAPPDIVDELLTALAPLVELARRGGRDRYGRVYGAQLANEERRRRRSLNVERATELARMKLSLEPPIGHSIWTVSTLALQVWLAWGSTDHHWKRPAPRTIESIIKDAVRDGRLAGLRVLNGRLEEIRHPRA